MSAIFERESVRVKKEVIKKVERMIMIGKFYDGTIPRKENMLKNLCNVLATGYNVPMPTLQFTENLDSTGICSTPLNRETGEINGETTITINKPSVITFLHEFRHYLQVKKGLRFPSMDVEEDARAWSLRVFSLASPDNFIRSVKAGNVMFLKWDTELNKAVDNQEQIDAERRGREAMENILRVMNSFSEGVREAEAPSDNTDEILRDTSRYFEAEAEAPSDNTDPNFDIDEENQIDRLGGE